MLTQFINFVKHFPDKKEEEERRHLEEEVVRKRIDDALPAKLKKESTWIKKRAPMGEMADKHTYSSSRKVASHKTKKKFIFDSYTVKQKLEEQNKEQEKYHASRKYAYFYQLIPKCKASMSKLNLLICVIVLNKSGWCWFFE